MLAKHQCAESSRSRLLLEFPEATQSSLFAWESYLGKGEIHGVLSIY